MLNNLLLSSLLEVALISSTCFLLMKPQSVLGVSLVKWEKAFKWGGLFFLVLTFFWSVILGIVLTLHNISFRI